MDSAVSHHASNGDGCKHDTEDVAGTQIHKRKRVEDGGEAPAVTIVTNLDLPSRTLQEIACGVFFESPACTALRVDHKTVTAFIGELARQYRANPYHNWAHAVDVLQTTAVMLKEAMPLCPPVDAFAMLVAAVSHDLDHIGLSNAELVRRSSECAILYNDVSVLENRSCTLLFHILRCPEYAITSSLTEEQRRRFRSVVLDVILTTDITDKDKQALASSKLDAAISAGLNVYDDAHRLAVLRFIMKAADIGSACKPFGAFMKWGSALCREHAAAADSFTTADFLAMQSGFLQRYALPMFSRLVELGILSKTYHAGVMANQARWSALSMSQQLALLEGRATPESSAGHSEHCDHAH